MVQKIEKEIISARNAARIMRMDYTTFMKQVQSGDLRLKFARRGHIYLFYRKDVEELFENSFQMVNKEEKND